MNKNYVTIRLSAEQVFSHRAMSDPRYERKATRTSAPPTPEAWARYRAAKAGLAALEAYEGTEWGGPDYGTEVPEPVPTLTFEYHETIEEWLDRCRDMSAEGDE